MAGRFLQRAALFIIAGTLLVGSSNAFAGSPPFFTLTQTLSFQYYAAPTFSDYDHDGIDDFTLWPGSGTIRLVSGRTGAVMRTWTDNYGQGGSFGDAVTTIPDIDGDGQRELLISAPAQPTANGDGAYFAISSGSPGGNVDTLPLAYRIDHPGGFPSGFEGTVVAGVGSRNVIGVADAGRAIITDSATGAVQARLSRSTAAYQSGFGHAVGAVGDVNGDGVEDFAIGDPNVLHSAPIGSGEIYIVSGATTTSGNNYAAVNTLPTLISTLVSTATDNLGAGLGPTFVNLGDPLPGDGVREQLIVAGTPYSHYHSGGFEAFLLTPHGGTMTFASVATFAGMNGLYFGENTIDCGDVNGDGVDDVAFLESGDGSLAKRGEILIVNGVGLLDGFDINSDVLQTISDPNFTVERNLRFLGDYNHDGRPDLEAEFSGPGFQTRIYSVPEPTTLAIIVALGLLGRRRHRREAARGH